jgi:hypothetical protein
MAKSKKNNKKSKPSVKVQDLTPGKNPEGGRKAGKDQQEYLVAKMNDIIITS